MPESVFGLPVHPLAVHATVVLVPLAALALLAHVLLPAARRRLGIVTPVLAVIALVLVPISTSSGEELEHRLPESDLIERHAELADGMLPWALALAVMAVGVYVLDRLRRPRAEGADAGSGNWATRPAVGLVATVLAVIAVVGLTQQVIRVGHSGATATWSDVPTAGGTSDRPGSDGDDG